MHQFEGCKKAALSTFGCGTWGTSAAAPTLAGIIGQLNAARAKVGKGTLGFLNPLIYQHPEVFNDITQVRSLLRGHDAQAPRSVVTPPVQAPSHPHPKPPHHPPASHHSPQWNHSPVTPLLTQGYTGDSEPRLCRVRRRA